MVRTKADAVPGTYRKAVAATAPRKSLGASSSANASSSNQASAAAKAGKYAGGNPVCARPTPTWQKGIGDFFGGPGRKPDPEEPEKENELPVLEEEAGSSKAAPRRSRPLSDDEDDE